MSVIITKRVITEANEIVPGKMTVGQMVDEAIEQALMRFEQLAEITVHLDDAHWKGMVAQPTKRMSKSAI